MAELTAKQRYQREWYQANKLRICQQKRDEYQPKQRQPRAKTVAAVAITVNHSVVREPVRRVVRKNITTPTARTARHKIEDILLAKELGINVGDL